MCFLVHNSIRIVEDNELQTYQVYYGRELAEIKEPFPPDMAYLRGGLTL